MSAHTIKLNYNSKESSYEKLAKTFGFNFSLSYSEQNILNNSNLGEEDPELEKSMCTIG